MAIKNRNNKILAFVLLFLLAAGIFFFHQNSPAATVSAEAKGKVEPERVYVGGMPIGIMLQSKGVLVIGKLDIITENGAVSPAEKSGITIGDVILKINDKELKGAQDLMNILGKYDNKEPLKLLVKRKGKEFTAEITPAKDIATKEYKLGLWVRDTAAGVGTVTYIKKDMEFAALGHPICDPESGELLPVSEGKVFDCSIVGITKGSRGRPGELKGIFSKEGSIGTVRANNRYGIYGKLTKIPENNLYKEPVEIAGKDEIKPGKAKIVTTIRGSEPSEYDIEIVKKNKQKTVEDRSLVIRVSDKRLLSETGGIVQGMSGSPILQNGKICGAVTHVFVNDPTQGYGLYLDWMLIQ